MGRGLYCRLSGASYKTVFEDFQVYRLLTYGYVQTTIWHLLANIFALWWVGSYLEQKIGTAFFFLMYHTSLVIAGASIFCSIPIASITALRLLFFPALASWRIGWFVKKHCGMYTGIKKGSFIAPSFLFSQSFRGSFSCDSFVGLFHRLSLGFFHQGTQNISGIIAAVFRIVLAKST